MNWEKAYERLREARIDDQIVNSELTIKKIKNLNEWHRVLFMEYFDSTYKGIITMGTFKTFRAGILVFLLQDKINTKQFSDITQIDIDDYISSKLDTMKENGVKHTINSLKSYFAFHQKYLTFTPVYIELDRTPSDIDNAILPLSCKEIELIREVIRNKPMLEFIFELAYESGIRFEDSKKFCKSRYNEENGTFNISKNEKIEVSDKIKKIIDKIKDREEFVDPRYKQGFTLDKLKELLDNKGFNRTIKSSDVNKAFEKKTSFECPECGKRYEATAENWVIKQYYENGDMWIVCKKRCGGNLNENN